MENLRKHRYKLSCPLGFISESLGRARNQEAVADDLIIPSLQLDQYQLRSSPSSVTGTGRIIRTSRSASSTSTTKKKRPMSSSGRIQGNQDFDLNLVQNAESLPIPEYNALEDKNCRILQRSPVFRNHIRKIKEMEPIRPHTARIESVKPQTTTATNKRPSTASIYRPPSNRNVTTMTSATINSTNANSFKQTSNAIDWSQYKPTPFLINWTELEDDSSYCRQVFEKLCQELFISKKWQLNFYMKLQAQKTEGHLHAKLLVTIQKLLSCREKLLEVLELVIKRERMMQEQSVELQKLSSQCLHSILLWNQEFKEWYEANQFLYAGKDFLTLLKEASS